MRVALHDSNNNVGFRLLAAPQYGRARKSVGKAAAQSAVERSGTAATLPERAEREEML